MFLAFRQLHEKSNFIAGIIWRILTEILSLHHFQKRKRFTKRKDSVAQLVEQYTFNVWVLGSNPSGITEKASTKVEAFYFYRTSQNSHLFSKI